MSLAVSKCRTPAAHNPRTTRDFPIARIGQYSDLPIQVTERKRLSVPVTILRLGTVQNVSRPDTVAPASLPMIVHMDCWNGLASARANNWRGHDPCVALPRPLSGDPMSDKIYEIIRPFYSVSIIRYTPQLTISPHAHDRTDLSVVLAGSFTEDGGHVRVAASAGDAVLTPRAKRHANQFGTRGAVLLTVTLHRDQDLVGDTATDQWQVGRTLDTYREAMRLVTALRVSPVSSAEIPDFDDLVIDLVAEGVASLKAPSLARTLPWLERVKAMLDQDSRNAPSVLELARFAGVHPVYLARRFRQQYGCSVAHYRRRARLLAAVALITSGDRTLACTAAECGFSDQSHLARECKAALRLSPSAIRALLRELPS